MSTRDVLLVALGVGLFLWCGLVVYSTVRNDRLRQKEGAPEKRP
ncbi:hypothetical protein [Muricoccus pecuniae]|uniref:Uncharacterized protein n=1 Tax=Muricoccus pecuniae TaxID=693023 RepID=A0A840Y0B5_9PROT|nr:hypothetical protein [Roseomonas pecuniae]MBB5693586.1 hypothetical protein [Roseomonas pecuniae]